MMKLLVMEMYTGVDQDIAALWKWKRNWFAAWTLQKSLKGCTVYALINLQQVCCVGHGRCSRLLDKGSVVVREIPSTKSFLLIGFLSSHVYSYLRSRSVSVSVSLDSLLSLSSPYYSKLISFSAVF